MTVDNLTWRVRQTMADTFGLEESDLPDSPCQTELARWTSLHHMILLAALEEHFQMTYSMEEMLSMTSFDRIIEVIRQRQAVGLPA